MKAVATFASDWLPYIKFVHVVCAFLWGVTVPPAYSVYVKRALAEAQRAPDDRLARERVLWAWDRLDGLVALEHIMWPIVLITGPLLVLGTGWAVTDTWLALKLAIVVFVFIPIEVFDVWFAHFYGAGVESRRDTEPAGVVEMREKQRRFYVFISPIVRLSMVAVFFLAIVKPG